MSENVQRYKKLVRENDLRVLKEGDCFWGRATRFKSSRKRQESASERVS